ncbi:MAG: hypothetical protein M1434_15190, partial [Chloroflexi bacterium]|nr:hypothetical protein [Chloroflexota bacterium]MCL5276066.1 hypothetical protein [Chloroflexota bacterium]
AEGGIQYAQHLVERQRLSHNSRSILIMGETLPQFTEPYLELLLIHSHGLFIHSFVFFWWGAACSGRSCARDALSGDPDGSHFCSPSASLPLRSGQRVVFYRFPLPCQVLFRVNDTFALDLLFLPNRVSLMHRKWSRSPGRSIIATTITTQCRASLSLSRVPVKIISVDTKSRPIKRAALSLLDEEQGRCSKHKHAVSCVRRTIAKS